MKPDSNDELSARLFESARKEPVPDGAEQRALAAARRVLAERRPAVAQLSRSAKWSAALTAFALAAGVASYVRRQQVTPVISPEPIAVHDKISKTEPKAAAATPGLVESAPPVFKAFSNAASAPTHSGPVSLSEELSALKRASAALEAGNVPAALSALDQYDYVLKGKVMRAEATLIRIEALSRAGRKAAASALAARFVEQNPGSPLVDRARSFVQQQK